MKKSQIEKFNLKYNKNMNENSDDENTKAIKQIEREVLISELADKIDMGDVTYAMSDEALRNIDEQIDDLGIESLNRYNENYDDELRSEVRSEAFSRVRY
tara:strand:- start:341 stop:640 length:300 start_codon:yes stop_codon:yes gene_type:complete